MKTAYCQAPLRDRINALRAQFHGCAIALFAGALTLTGCAGIPSDHDALPQQDLARVQLASSIKLAHEGWPQAQWWTRYDDPQLNGLIAQALKDGPTLQIASARIGSAQAALKLDSSQQGVNVDFNAASNRQRYSVNGLFPPPIGGAYYTETTMQAVATYEVDWWGKHRHAIEAALGEVNARRAEYAQAEQTLAAAVAQSYLALLGDWARLDNLKSMQTIQKELVADKIKRVTYGVASVDTQHIAEAGLDFLKEQAIQMETQIEREREALRALLGAAPQALTDLKPQPLPDPPAALPASLGIELLARRPDLQAARWRVEASLERIEVAKALFYPDINLTAFFGTDVVSLDKLLSPDSRTLYFGPSLSLPLFDSGRLKAGLGVARTERNEMIADYNQSVFNAVRDVAEEGATMQGLQKKASQQVLTGKAIAALLHSAQERYRQGLIDHSTLLNTELAVSEQQDMSLQLKSQILTTDVALIKALGGGYEVRPDSARPAGTMPAQ